MNTGNLRYHLELLSPVVYKGNNYGDRLKNQTTYTSSSLWGAMVSWQGSDAVYNGYTANEQTLVFTVRTDDRIKDTCKVRYSGSLYDIDAITLIPSNLNYIQITLKS